LRDDSNAPRIPADSQESHDMPGKKDLASREWLV
jgi:hypothetical protein